MLWIRNDFFSNPDPTFRLVSDPTWIFPNILDINFTLVFLPCKCVRLLIFCRDISLLWEYFFWQKEIYIFNMSSFVFQGSYTSNSFGSRAAQIRNDFFRIRIRMRVLLKVSDPTGSGFTTEVGIDTCESVVCSTSIKNPTFDRKE